MPDMVLNRSHTLRSLAGRIINFEKNTPTWVPPECVPEALAIGAEGVTEKLDILKDETPVENVQSLEERKEKVFSAFKVMSTREVRGDFTGQGVPNIKVIAGLAGFEIAGKERDDLWREFKGIE